jgi:hypothetical protein
MIARGRPDRVTRVHRLVHLHDAKGIANQGFEILTEWTKALQKVKC